MTFLLCSGRRKFIDLIQIPIVSSNIAALETSIDGSIFFTCTTCIVYQYFKELVAFVLKAGAKVRALFLTTKLFRKFFVLFFKWDSTFSLSQFVKAFFSWKAGAKVRPFDIYSKYIKLFFLIIFEYIC